MTAVPLRNRRALAGRFITAIILSCAAAASARAQDPAQLPPDSARIRADSAVVADSARIRLDSALVADSAAVVPDSLRPIRRMPSFGATRTTNPALGVWVFERDSLRSAGVISVTELIERIPGIIAVRGGFYAQPEAVSALGTTAGRMEVVLDGFVLDPLLDGTYDLSRLELVHMKRVVVERRLDMLRIEIETLEPFDPRAYAAVEAAVAEPQSRMFRGLFLTPRVFGQPLGLGVERLDTDGTRRAENANTFAGWLKYAVVRGKSGVQLELRRNNVERAGEVLSTAENRVHAPGAGSRTDWVVRARSGIGSMLTGELFYGRSIAADSLGLRVATPADTVEREKNAGVQFGGRLSAVTPIATSDIALRFRDDDRLPGMEVNVNTLSQPLSVLQLAGSLTWADWREAGSALSYSARGAAGSFAGVSLFGEAAGGKRGIPGFGAAGRVLQLNERTAFRGGVEFNRGRLRVMAAALRVETDSVPSFRLPFDSLPRLYGGGELTGWEVGGTVPLFWRPLSLEGWVQTWASGTSWIYVPNQTVRAALAFHTIPLRSGNLEILARLQGRLRGPMTVPGVAADLPEVPETRAVDFLLDIRILEFRIFFRAEDMLHTDPVFDVPGREIAGPRILYGVRWQFWN